MKILITGGLGFIGTRLATSLLHHDHDVVLVDSLSPQIHGDVPQVRTPDGATIERVDVRELAHREDLLEGVDTVYHLAAETGTAQSMYRIRHYVDVNDTGTAALLEAMSRCARRPKQIVLASSRSVYGEGAYRHPGRPGESFVPEPRTAEQLAAGRWDLVADDGMPLEPVATPESSPFLPGSVYAATKASQELLVTVAAKALGMRSIILRFQNVYGEGQSLRNPYTGIISIFYNRARQGLDIPIYEDGLESRDFVHLDDVVAALQRVLECRLPDGMVVNVGSGAPTSVHALARSLIAAAGFDVPVRVTGQYRSGDIRHCFADIGRLAQYLGLTPAVSLQSGLDRFCAWASSQPVFEDKLDAATAELRAKGLAQ